MDLKRTKILVDCDGVLMNWEYAMNCWMQQRGFEIKKVPKMLMI